MKQQYPGDVRPLMAACADLAQRRAADLARVRSSVATLKQDLARTLNDFDQMRSSSAARVGAMREHTVRSLKADRQSRSQQVDDLRARFARERADARGTLTRSLDTFRTALQAAVGDIKSRTQQAKSERFKSGSFESAKPTPTPPKPSATVSKKAQGKRPGARDFLDAIEY